MADTPQARTGMSLIEVVVSSLILGVISIAYAGLYKGQLGQKEAYEELGHAMEIVARQIEFLRQLDLTLPTGSGALERRPPFNSVFNGNGTAAPPCPDGNNMAYVQPSAQLEAGFSAGTTRAIGAWLTGPVRRIGPPSMTTPMADPDNCVLPGRSTVGLPDAANRPAELTLPAALVGKDYTVLVRATRVRGGVAAVNSVQFDQFLVKYQISVFRAGRPVLVVPYLREAEL